MSVDQIEAEASAELLHIEEVNDPGIFRWVIAIVCTLAVSTALYFADLAGNGLHFAKLNQEIQQKLAKNEDLSKVLLDEKYKPLLADRKVLISKVLGVKAQIESNNFSQASAWISGAYPHDKETQQELVGILRELIKKKKSKDLFSSSRNEILQRKVEIAREYLRKASEFAEMLGYESESIRLISKSQEINTVEDAKKLEVAFYSSGIFEKLPKIATLPDNIPNYLRVEQHLEDATRAKVIGQLVRSKSKLRKELISFQKESEPLRQSMASLKQDLANVEQEKASAVSEKEKSKARAIELTNLLVTGLVTPQIDPKVVSTYEHFRVYSAKFFNTELPELTHAQVSS